MHGYPVVVRFPTQWGDMDAFHHINNARYFTWFESARIAFFRAAGLATDGQPEVGPILAHTSCDFRKPVRWPADVAIGARVTEFGNTSFVMEYAAALADAEDEPVATGKGVIVLFNYQTGEKVPVPLALRTAIEQLGEE